MPNRLQPMCFTSRLDVYKRQILNYVQKSSCNGFTDGEIYGQAVHYYDENEIEVGKPIRCQIAVNHVVELTAEEKAEARQNAIRQYQDEEVRRLQNLSLIHIWVHQSTYVIYWVHVREPNGPRT